MAAPLPPLPPKTNLSATASASASSSSSSKEAAASSSSSSSEASRKSKSNKRRASSAVESASPEDLSVKERRIETATEIFMSSLANASKIWEKHNKNKNSLIQRNLIPLLTNPLTTTQQMHLLNLIQSFDVGQQSAKEHGEIPPNLNQNLLQEYNKLKAEQTYNETGLLFLTEVIRNHQFDLIESLLKTLDLSQNNLATIDCLLAAANSNPKIARLVLDKNPRLSFTGLEFAEKNFQLHKNLYKLSFDNNDLSFFQYLINLKVSPALPMPVILRDSDPFSKYKTNSIFTVYSPAYTGPNSYFSMSLESYFQQPDCRFYTAAQIATTSNRFQSFLEILLRQPDVLRTLDHLFYAAAKHKAYSNCRLILNLVTDKNSFSASKLILTIFKEAIQNNEKEIIQLLAPIGTLSQEPEFLWLAVCQPYDETIQLLIQHNASPTKAMEYGISHYDYLKHDTPLENKAPYDRLILLGGDVNLPNNKETLLAYALRRARQSGGINKWKESVEANVRWFLNKGGDLSLSSPGASSAFSVICSYGNLGLVKKILKLCGRDSLKSIINKPFYEHDFYSEREFDSHGVLDHLFTLKNVNIQKNIELFLSEWIPTFSHLCLYDNHINSLKDHLDYLIGKGGNPFKTENQTALHPLLVCCKANHKFFLVMREYTDYKKHLQVQRNGMGIFTYLALGENQHVFSEEIFMTASKDFSDKIESNEVKQDAFFAYILLRALGHNKNKLGSIPAFARFLKWNYYFPSQLLAHKEALLKLIHEVSAPEEKQGKANAIELIFKEIWNQFELDLFTIKTEHIKEASRMTALNADQEKQLALIDYQASIEEMLKTLDFSKRNCSAKEFCEVVHKFLGYLKNRVFVTGMPPGLPEGIKKDKNLAPIFSAFEKKCREIIPRKEYDMVLADFANSKKYGIVLDSRYHDLLNAALTQSCAGYPITIDHLEEFAKSQQRQEEFFVEIEDKLRLIIFSYLSEKKAIEKSKASSPSSSSSSSSSAAAAGNAPLYDPDSAFTLIATIVEAMSKCATKWAAELQILEEYALGKIHLLSHPEGLKKQTDLERQVHSALAKQRSGILRLWARNWTDIKVNQLRAQQEHPQVQQAEWGKEIHYYFKALESRGQYYGIPRAEKNKDFIVKWSPEMDINLTSFVSHHYFPSTNLIDSVFGAIKGGDIERQVVVDWMGDNLINDWKKEAYEITGGKITNEVYQKLAQSRTLYETILKEKASNKEERKKALDEKIFPLIWPILSGIKEISFHPFEESIRNVLGSGKTYDQMREDVKKIINNAVMRSRRADFTSYIHDQEALNSEQPAFIIRREMVREMLMKLNVIGYSSPKNIMISSSSSAAAARAPVAPPAPVPQAGAPAPQQPFVNQHPAFLFPGLPLPPLPPINLLVPPAHNLGPAAPLPPLPAAFAPGVIDPIFQFREMDEKQRRG